MPESPLNLLIDARMVSEKPHGIARYVVDLCRELAGLGHRVSILAASEETRQRIGSDFIQESIICKIPFANPLDALELSARVRGRLFDVVHFPSFSMPFIMPVRSVVTIHDLIHLRTGSTLNKIYYRTLVKRGLDSCGKVIAVSEWTKNDLHENLKVNSTRIQVIRNGVSLGEAPSWTPAERPSILCVSNPKPHKNVFTLIRACQRLWDNGIQFGLTLSLGGADFPAHWNLREKDIENVTLLKSVSDQELRKQMLACRVLVSPAHWEGFNYPAAEAMTCGTPVLLSRGSAHDEFHGSRLAYYEPAPNHVKLAEALVRFIENPVWGPVIHNLVSQREMAEATVEVYRQVARLT
jgi:glycosyltransferase involved in cell wall biosynthesis